MGTVQNAMNQLLATTAAAAVAGTHLSEQRKARELTSVYNFNVASAEYNKAAKDEGAVIDEEMQRRADEEEYQKQASAHEALAGEKNKMSKEAFDMIYGKDAFAESEKHLLAERQRLDLLSKSLPKRLEEARHRTYESELARDHAFDMLSEKSKKEVTGGRYNGKQ